MGIMNEEREKEIRKQPIPTKEECLAFYKELVKLADVRFVPYYKMGIKVLEQQPRQGHWIEVTNGRGGHECDVCHDYAPSFQSGNEYLSAFCPNCGADMRGDKNDR